MHFSFFEPLNPKTPAETLKPIAFGGTLIALYAVGSLLARRFGGKSILRPVYPNTRYAESRISARSNRTFISSLQRPSRCVWITVTDSHIHLGIHFPFNAFLLPMITALDRDIPLSDIVSATHQPNVFHPRRVRLQLRRTDTEGTESLDLDLRNPGEFLAAIGPKKT